MVRVRRDRKYSGDARSSSEQRWLAGSGKEGGRRAGARAPGGSVGHNSSTRRKGDGQSWPSHGGGELGVHGGCRWRPQGAWPFPAARGNANKSKRSAKRRQLSRRKELGKDGAAAANCAGRWR
jgi:hypothetical protein